MKQAAGILFSFLFLISITGSELSAKSAVAVADSAELEVDIDDIYAGHGPKNRGADEFGSDESAVLVGDDGQEYQLSCEEDDGQLYCSQVDGTYQLDF